jgi:hypothetical protein
MEMPTEDSVWQHAPIWVVVVLVVVEPNEQGTLVVWHSGEVTGIVGSGHGQLGAQGSETLSHASSSFPA